MLELTDEQESLAIERINEFNDFYTSEEILQKMYNMLTLPQIKQLAEQHNASVVQWVEFDYDDETTYPKNDSIVWVLNTYGMYTKDRFVDDMWLTHDIIKWAYLPQPKEK